MCKVFEAANIIAVENAEAELGQLSVVFAAWHVQREALFGASLRANVLLDWTSLENAAERAMPQGVRVIGIGLPIANGLVFPLLAAAAANSGSEIEQLLKAVFRTPSVEISDLIIGIRSPALAIGSPVCLDRSPAVVLATTGFGSVTVLVKCENDRLRTVVVNVRDLDSLERS